LTFIVETHFKMPEENQFSPSFVRFFAFVMARKAPR
jgi:hypothetical protein